MAKRFVMVLVLGIVVMAIRAQEMAGEIVATYTLGDVRISELLDVENDRTILLGGIGSDMWRSADDEEGVFWVITDRGPNGLISVEDRNRRTFPIPDFTPLILQVQVEGEAINILQVIPVMAAEGVRATGLSNIDGHDEKPWDYTAMEELTYNQDGLDTEGLVRTADGNFWISEEYSPSIAVISPEGVILKRFVPEGLAYDSTSYEVVANLPAILATRRGNRGFEALALSSDGSTLYAAVQSPLRNPDADTGDASVNARIIAFDIASETVVGEYVYQFQPSIEFDGEDTPGEMKLSGLLYVNENTLIVLERTDAVAKLYAVDLTSATNILGTAWDDAATAPSLEANNDLSATDVTPLAKTLVIDLDTLEGTPDKIEGLAMVDSQTLAIINDNDFALGDFDAEGNVMNNGVQSQILYVRLAQPLE
ncbi:MAG: esterase-like activity of phytase family protein [Phototrophicaceae bacterium]